MHVILRFSSHIERNFVQKDKNAFKNILLLGIDELRGLCKDSNALVVDDIFNLTRSTIEICSQQLSYSN